MNCAIINPNRSRKFLGCLTSLVSNGQRPRPEGSPKVIIKDILSHYVFDAILRV
jgi:hypothetical protein